jgi:hypothetical protein
LGLSVKRSAFGSPGSGSSNTIRRGRRSSTSTSVAVVGRHLPARMRNGTPAQREQSMCTRTAAKVSTVESGATPFSSW